MKEDVYYNEWEDDSDMMKTIPHWVEDDILARDNEKYKIINTIPRSSV